MKTIQETRLDCLRMSAALATAKIIHQHEVITRATEFYDWVIEDHCKPTVKSMEQLAEKYR